MLGMFSCAHSSDSAAKELGLPPKARRLGGHDFLLKEPSKLLKPVGELRGQLKPGVTQPCDFTSAQPGALETLGLSGVR